MTDKSFLNDTAKLVGSDGVHLTDDGHKYLAERLQPLALVVVVALLGAAGGPTWPRVVGAAAALGVAGSVGVALVVSEFHYPTDVVGGACVAAAVVGGVALLLDRIPLGQASTHPAAPI